MSPQDTASLLIPMSATAISVSVVIAVYVFDRIGDQSTQTEKKPSKIATILILVSVVLLWSSLILSAAFYIGFIPLIYCILDFVEVAILAFGAGITILVIIVIYLGGEILKYQ